MWLIDTNVLSDMRKLRTRRASPELDRWVSTFTFSDAFISAISLLELRTGELRLVRKDAAQAEVLREWLDDQIIPTFAGRTLAVDGEVALRCAELHVPVTIAYHDALIAATALVHGLTVVTRNVKHFEPMGCKVLNPWEGERARGQSIV